MKTRILKLKNDGRKNTYCLINISTSDDFNIVAEILRNKFHAKFIEKLGAIWAYGEKYEYQGKYFILGIEDDIDCYLEATNKESPSEDETWLVQLAELLVNEINNRWEHSHSV
jgi:recombinational DNA repair protein RecR